MRISEDSQLGHLIKVGRLFKGGFYLDKSTVDTYSRVDNYCKRAEIEESECKDLEPSCLFLEIMILYKCLR